MCPQMACLRRCIVTLVAFVWFFPTVCFQMVPQMASIGRCIVAFMWHYNIIGFFLQDFNICILQNKIAFFQDFAPLPLCVVFVQIVAWNWVIFIIDSWSPAHTFTFSQMKCKCLFDNGHLKEFSFGLHFLFAFIIPTSLTVPKNWNITLVSTYGAMVHLSELSHQKNRLSHLHCHVSFEYIFMHGTTLDVTFHIHGFCHGTMGKPITWQNPYTMTFAMVYGLCHRSMAKPMGYPNPA